MSDLQQTFRLGATLQLARDVLSANRVNLERLLASPYAEKLADSACMLSIMIDKGEKEVASLEKEFDAQVAELEKELAAGK